MGALGDPYITRNELKTYLKIPLTDTADDDLLDDALASVSQEINDICERQFNNTGVVATARTFVPLSPALVFIDDVYTTTDLVIAYDDDDDGVFETTVTADQYELYPLNGVVSGMPGWPYTSVRLRRSAGSRFPCHGSASAQVTARWGWAAVPDPVKEACKIASSETFSLKDARFGVAGFGAMGDLRVRDNPMVMKKLRPYIRDAVKVS